MIAPNAAPAAAWGDKLPPRRLRLKKWTPHRSGPLLGYCSVELVSGMVVNELQIMTGKNGFGVAMPAQRQLDRYGPPKTDVNGKPVYNQIINFVTARPAPVSTRLSSELVRTTHPEDLDKGGA